MANSSQIFNLIARINRANKLSTKQQDELLEKHELTRLDWDIMYSLYRASQVSQASLARSIARAASNIRTPIEMLGSRGLINRSTDVVDRRKNNMVLSHQGDDLVEKLLPHFESYHNQLMEGIGLQEQKDLERLLNIIVENLKKK